ncbi:alpha-L-rhamnosidase C-terminal domain-containing protein [Cohnella sp. GCM10020058]|uniref:alpha-L-rhamnosidase-related protein n=1 Tax=Cohnella sp. GCM10020058 TaxID=3317330 RepID=UPI00362B2048
METNASWTAEWIWTEALHARSETALTEIAYFRTSFTLADADARLTLRVSADSRYRLYVNGVSAAVGPCKGNGNVHYYETIDVSGLLRAGANAIAVKVVHFAASEPLRMGEAGPISVFRSSQGGLLLEGVLEGADGGERLMLKTDASWRCLKDSSTCYEPGEMGRHYLGYPETVDGGQVPHGWEGIEFDDSSWASAVAVSPTAYPMTGELPPWFLAERPIPPLYEIRRDFSAIVRTEGIDRDAAMLLAAEASAGAIAPMGSRQPLVVPPNTRIVIDLAAERLSTGYLRFELFGGAGSLVRTLCAECYEDPPGPRGERRKGIRDDASEGKILYGETDTYRVAGRDGSHGQAEVYEPFWFRTFRYVRLTIETADEPLRLRSFHYRETGYPMDAAAVFECSDPAYSPLWDISLNTLKNCMHETYEDCPFYEQLQYTMDTMMQAIFTYNVSGDDRLARRAIHDFHSSMLPNGMLQCRYPSVFPQVIPGFALYWIFMLRDHYRYYGDRELVIRYRPTMEQVLGWFDRQLNEQGIVGAAPEGYWSFVDWVEEWHGLWGVPTASLQGPITVYSFLYIAALQIAAELNEATGRADAAAEYERRAEKVQEAVRAYCLSPDRQLFQDGPGVEAYSQHSQIWAVLSGTVSGEEARSLMRQTLTDPTLAQVSFSMSYFLFRALSRAEMYGKSFALWSKWTEQVDLNLTTWMEDPVSQRSDCHAWGAIPLYEFPAEVLGVQPALPGFDVIRIAPKPGPLTWARGTVVTRHGPVRVDWRVDESGGFVLTAEGPAGIPVELVLPSKQSLRFEDAATSVTATCTLREYCSS